MGLSNDSKNRSMLHEGTDLNSFNAFQNLRTIFLNKIVYSKPCQCRSTQKTSLGPLLLIACHARRGSGHVYMYTDYIPCQEKEAVMYTCIRIIGTDIDYIPCQEKEAVMYTCIRIIGTHIDYIPCQEKEAVMYACIRITYHARRRKRSCIHVCGLHTMPGEGGGHVYMYTDYRYRY